VGKFLELARSNPPNIVVDEAWGAKFAHPAGASQFACYGWCARPVIRDGHLLVRCILAKSSGEGLCGKTTQLSRVSGGRMEVKFHNHMEHLSKQHKRFLLEPSFISGLTAELDIEVEGGRGAKRGRVGSGGVSDEVDKFAVEDYKDALLKMALADGRPLSLGDSVGFRQFAAELSLPYVSRNALNLHFKNRVKTLIHEPRARAVKLAMASVTVACGAINVEFTIRLQASADGWDGMGNSFESLVKNYAKVVPGPAVRVANAGQVAAIAPFRDVPGAPQLRPNHTHLALRHWERGVHGAGGYGSSAHANMLLSQWTEVTGL
jgi:hypothetical protein